MTSASDSGSPVDYAHVHAPADSGAGAATSGVLWLFLVLDVLVMFVTALSAASGPSGPSELPRPL
jgi:hypothetical protein